MLTISIVAFCVALLVFAFVAPRLSKKPERGGKRSLGKAASWMAKAPGRIGRWLAKPFHIGQKAVGKSGSTGRKARRKSPV